MDTLSEVVAIHPTGEVKSRVQHTENSRPVDTPGGRFYAEWDTEAARGAVDLFFPVSAGGRTLEGVSAQVSTDLYGQSWERGAEGDGDDIIERSEWALEVCAHERGAR